MTLGWAMTMASISASREPRRHAHHVAQLAVDLDRQLDLVGRHAGPGRRPARPRCGSSATSPPAASRRRDHSSSAMCGATGASISSSRRTASSQPGRARGRRAAVAHQQVGQLHQLGHDGVPAEALVVVRDTLAACGGRRRAALARRPPRPRRRAAARRWHRRLLPVRVEGHGPDAAQEAVDALDALRVPRAALVPGAHEHQEQAHRVGAVAGHQLVGVLDVAAALAHALAVGAQDLALVEEPLEGLALVDHAQVGQRLAEEAAVQQVHDGVLGAAGVLVHRTPALLERAVDGGVLACAATGSATSTRSCRRRCPWCPSRAAPGRRSWGRWWAGTTRPSPAGCRHPAGSRSPPAAAPAARSSGTGTMPQSAAAVDDRDGRAPGALAAHQPVADAVGDGGAGLAARRQVRHDGGEALGPGHAAVRRRCSRAGRARPWPGRPPSSGASSASSGPATTRTMGSPKRCANAKSRSSWPGTAMMAPVP